VGEDGEDQGGSCPAFREALGGVVTTDLTLEQGDIPGCGSRTNLVGETPLNVEKKGGAGLVTAKNVWIPGQAPGGVPTEMQHFSLR
jgi:hypothetical protein